MSAKEFFQSDNGQSSHARMLMFIIVVWKLVEGTAVLLTSIVNGTPAALTDMPLQWAGIVGVLYGLNKFGTKEVAAPIIEVIKEIPDAAAEPVGSTIQ
jgi:hypothetical protein